MQFSFHIFSNIIDEKFINFLIWNFNLDDIVMKRTFQFLSYSIRISCQKICILLYGFDRRDRKGVEGKGMDKGQEERKGDRAWEKPLTSTRLYRS